MQPVKKVIYIRGFTMVEMIIVIVVVGAIFATGALVLGRALESYDLAQKTTDADWQGRVAMERVVRELRDIRSATVTDLDVSSGVQIWFINANGNGVCFYRDASTPGRLMRSDAASAAACSAVVSNPQPLADNVTSLNFDYYDNTGTATASAVYYITVRLAVSENSIGGGINETYRATMQPRRF